MNRDFVGRAGFEALLSGRGIASDDTVILYGGNNNWFAAYAYWYFKVYGHRSVKLLDGGRKKWELDSREMVTEVPQRPATTYRAQEQDTSIRAYRDEVIAAIGQLNLVDVRSPDEFAGRLLAPAHLPQEQAQRGGHIPGAKNVPWSKAAAEDGTFKPDETLRVLYAEEAGLDFGKDTIAYCRIGERSPSRDRFRRSAQGRLTRCVNVRSACRAPGGRRRGERWCPGARGRCRRRATGSRSRRRGW